MFLFFSSHLQNIHKENKGITKTEKGQKIERLILSPKDEKKKQKQGSYIIGFQGKDYIIYVRLH